MDNLAMWTATGCSSTDCAIVLTRSLFVWHHGAFPHTVSHWLTVGHYSAISTTFWCYTGYLGSCFYCFTYWPLCRHFSSLQRLLAIFLLLLSLWAIEQNYGLNTIFGVINVRIVWFTHFANAAALLKRPAMSISTTAFLSNMTFIHSFIVTISPLYRFLFFLFLKGTLIINDFLIVYLLFL